MLTVATPVGLHLLHQSAIWRAWGDHGQLVTLYLEDLTPAHRQRLLAWLRDHAGELLARELDQVARSYRRGELSDADYGAATRELENLDPAEWIDGVALVRRLRQLGARPPAAHRRGLLRRHRP